MGLTSHISPLSSLGAASLAYGVPLTQDARDRKSLSLRESSLTIIETPGLIEPQHFPGAHSKPLTDHNFDSYRVSDDSDQAENDDEWSEGLDLDSHAEGDQDEPELVARMGRIGVPRLGKSRFDILTAVERIPIMDEILKRPLQVARGPDRRIEPKKLALLRAHLPPAGARIKPPRTFAGSRTGPWLLSKEEEAQAQPRVFLRLGELQRLRRIARNADYSRLKRRRSAKRVVRSSSSSPSISSGSRSPESSASSSASDSTDIQAAMRASDLDVPTWAAQKPRLARKRRPVQDIESTAAISASSTQAPLIPTANVPTQRQLSAKKFRGHSTSMQQADGGSSGSPTSAPVLRSTDNSNGSTSWDPPLEDNRSLPPGSHWINPILVDSPSPTHSGASLPTTPRAHQVSESE